MTRTPVFGTVVVALISLAACAHLGGGSRGPSPLKSVSPAVRLEAIRHAQVWSDTNVRGADLKAGPPGDGAFKPNEPVTCDYVAKAMSGHSPKFTCKIGEDDEVKVKFGQDNGEVFGEVAATRLFWALGFDTDRMYPVRVICRGCPAELGGAHGDGNTSVFEFSAIERKLPGREIETTHIAGWAWPELDLVDPKLGGASRAERDALKLLAVLVQHTDSKPEQQRLLCLSKRKDLEDHGQVCPDTFMMVNDLGQTFGHANVYNRNAPGSVNFAEWSQAPVWKDPKNCIGDMSKSLTGTLVDPPISEEGRKFLADRLVQLSDRQLRDLFSVARFPERTGNGRAGSVDDWVDAFKRKRDEIVHQTCPS